ncbi:MAG: response regulator transcription factor [Flavobacteriales bacterium]
MDSNLAAGLSLTDQELEFIKHLCTELTNKEIADRMHVSPRTSEGWRKILCDKLQVNTRVGIVLFALRNKLVE